MGTRSNIYRTTAIAQFHAVAPNNHLSAKIGSALWTSKVRERVISPYPSVVGDGKGAFGMFHGPIIVGKTREKRFDEGMTSVSKKYRNTGRTFP